MKIKTSALLLSAFFVSSVVAVNAVQDESVYLMDAFNDADIADYEQFDYEEDEVILMETREDKARIREAKRIEEQQRKAALAKEQAAEKLKVAEGKDKAQEEALKQAPIAEELADKDQQVALTTEQQLKNKRKALDLGPPIPPGSFGGGNGNGGPGSEQPAASPN